MYDIVSRNNTFISNKAGIMGGGIFISNSLNSTISIKDDKEMDYNEDDNNNYIYTSLPYYISLNTKFEENTINIITGEYLPLSFTLHDMFGNIYVDKSRYYSSITLKVLLIEKNDMFDSERYDYKDNGLSSNLFGNVGSFEKG